MFDAIVCVSCRVLPAKRTRLNCAYSKPACFRELLVYIKKCFEPTLVFKAIVLVNVQVLLGLLGARQVNARVWSVCLVNLLVRSDCQCKSPSMSGQLSWLKRLTMYVG